MTTTFGKNSSQRLTELPPTTVREGEKRGGMDRGKERQMKREKERQGEEDKHKHPSCTRPK